MAHGQNLRQALAQSFSIRELQQLCVDLEIDHESIGGLESTKDTYIFKLVAYLQRQGNLPGLISHCAELRPNIQWAELPIPNITPTNSPVAWGRGLILIVFGVAIVVAAIIANVQPLIKLIPTPIPRALPTTLPMPLPTTTPMAFDHAKEGESLIIVADFDNRSEGKYKGIEPAQYIYDQLIEQTQKDNPNIRVEHLHSILTEKTVRSVGESYNATLLLWGYYDSLSVKPVIERIKKATYTPLAHAERISITDPNKVEVAITTNLPNQISFLVLLTLALNQYSNGVITETLHYLNMISTTIDLNKVSSQNKSEMFYWHGIAYYDKGDYDQAIKDLNQAIQLEPNFISAYHNRGVAYYFKGNHDQAITDYTQAIKLKPDDAEAYYNRGIAYDNKGDYDQAIKDYTQAIQLKPDDVYIYYCNRGVAYGNKGDYDQAITDYTQAIKLKPDGAIGYVNRGGIYAAKGDYDQAIKDYDQATQVEPNFTAAYWYRGDIYYLINKYDQAIKDYDQALKLEPKNAIGYNNRGNAYAAKGDHDQAIKDFNQAIQFEPNLANAYYSRGIVYYRKGDYDQAITDYTQAIQFKPDLANIYYSRGLVYKAKKDKPKAIADFRKCVELTKDPNAIKQLKELGAEP